MFARFRIAGALMSFMWRRKMWWMVPLVGMLLVLGLLVIFGQSGAFSAFVYASFHSVRSRSPAVQLGSTRREAPLPPDAPFYKKLWRGWQRVSRAIGNLFSRIVTTLAYLIVIPIFAIGVKLFSDPLG